MMKKQLPKRDALDVKHTWDMGNLFKSESLYEEAFDEVEKDVQTFCDTFENKLDTAKRINEALLMFQDIQAKATRVAAYASLQSSTDSISEANQMRVGKSMIRFQTIYKQIAFFTNELKQKDDTLLQEAAKLNEDNRYYLEDIIKDKQYTLTPDIEKTFVALSPVLNAPYMNYWEEEYLK